MDNFCNTAGVMVAGGRQLLYAGRVYTSTTGIGDRSHGHPHNNPRTNSCHLDRTSEESAAVGFRTSRTAAVFHHPTLLQRTCYPWFPSSVRRADDRAADTAGTSVDGWLFDADT